ncbi:hypothetical protein [Roseivirga sp.]|uniref:hypothetical protein n=1 Tax=Roseivirga sp. TaxID=1964215 RepID=UPI003B53009D
MKLIYLAGNWHSGSTLLDIYLGNGPDCFSMGELIQISRDGIEKEYCSCHEKIEDCEFWSDVFEEWNSQRSLEDSRFKVIHEKYKLSVRNNVWVIFYHLFPTSEVKTFWEDCQKLYQIIYIKSESEFLVESSKNPLRLMLLKRVFDNENLFVLYLKRNFVGVLESYRKKYEKDLSKGIEKDIQPKKVSKTAFKHLSISYMTYFLKCGLSMVRLRYEEFVGKRGDSEPLTELSEELDIELTSKEKLKPGHLLAGNRLRLKKELKIEKMRSKHSELGQAQISFAKLIEFFSV